MDIQRIKNSKKIYFKFIAGFLGIIAGVFILFNLALWGLYKHEWGNQQEKWQKVMDESGVNGEIITKKFTLETYERAMADTYGGKTPQETLRMYIDAVEKEDFELASKYFVSEEDEQKYLKEKLISMKQKELLYIHIGKIRQALEKQIEYSSNQDTASIYEPIFIAFFKYPNNIWKISGI